MKILVLTQGYPRHEDVYQMAFVHTRNLEYLKLGINVDVLCFSNKRPYVIDNIRVIDPSFKVKLKNYDAIISHAPNLRNHYRFIWTHKKDIVNLVLVFHGHEILKINEYYPEEYSWIEGKSRMRKIVQACYDVLKLKTLKRLLEREGTRAIYVSDWMFLEGRKCLELLNQDSKKWAVINNAINPGFIEKQYEFDDKQKLADFITIRPLDGKKYAVDKVVELARHNPQFMFHIYGKGNFFKYFRKPENVEVFYRFVRQEDIPNLLNKYCAAVMPTRLDSQGVMMCEMASYGIPMLLSNLPVCREMLGDYQNCIFVDNEQFENIDLSSIRFSPLRDFSVVQRFSPSKLARAELDFILKR